MNKCSPFECTVKSHWRQTDSVKGYSPPLRGQTELGFYRGTNSKEENATLFFSWQQEISI